MRRPIQRQLLAPMLLIVVLSSAVTAILAAGLGMRAARLAERDRLIQLAATLTDAGFPLTDAVLQRMAELSGAEFVTLNEVGRVERSSRDFSAADRDRLRGLPLESGMAPHERERVLRLANGDYRAVRIPIKTSGHAMSLVILTSEARWDALAWRAALPPLIAGLLAAAGASFCAALLARRFVRRIRELARRAAKLAEGRFEPAALPGGDDELRDLAIALNDTAEQLEHYERRIRAGERLATLGRLGAGMAHQLRNAITGARMALDLHSDELPREASRESLAVALRQLALMEAYLKRFLSTGADESPLKSDVDLTALITETLELVAPICRHHGIDVRWQAEEPVGMFGDADALRQMLLNLITNAIEAVQPLPHPARAIGVELDSAADRCVTIHIWDQGPGPSARIAGSLFERFVTDKPDGTGLGLAVAQGIALYHGGTITWRRGEGRTWFEARLARETANSQACGGA